MPSHKKVHEPGTGGPRIELGDIYETSPIIAIYKMIFIAILAPVTLSRDRPMQKMRWL
jgi:hypothetical protein